MRIIAGEHRGRKLLSPEGEATRPITDRVKQALFDRLAAHGKIESARVLDLFSGTGSMGLECLSRGAAHATFVERDRSAIDLLKRNIETLRLAAASTVLPGDALSEGLLHKLPATPLRIIFVDPPYAMMTDDADLPRVLKQVERLAARAAPGAWLILRTATGVDPGAIPGWAGPESWRYGSMTLHRYARDSGSNDSDVDGPGSEPAA